MSRGHDRERATKRLLEMDGWLVIRAAGSLGFCDLVCLHPDHSAMLVEVKSTAAGPYEHFGPADRAALSKAAEDSGAEAWLVHWPSRGAPTFIPESDWPETKVAA